MNDKPVPATPGGPLAVPCAAPRGTELVERNDVNMPRVSLDGKSGGFRNTATGEIFQTLTIVPVFFSKSQVLFADTKEGDAEGVAVMCRSANAVYSTDYDPEAIRRYGLANPAGACAECQFNQWGKALDGKRTPPRCRLQYNFLVLMPKGTAAVLSLHGTSLSAAKVLLSTAKGESIDFWRKSYVLATRKAGAGSMTYYTLEVAKVEDTTDEQVLSVAEMLYEDFVGGNPMRAGEQIGGGRVDVSDSAVAPRSPGPTEAEVPEEEVPF
jgi:hypothetical protein